MKEKVIAFLREQGILGEDKTEFVITFPGKEVLVNDLIEKFATYIERDVTLRHREKDKLTLKKVQRIAELLTTKKKIHAAIEIGKLQSRLAEVELMENEIVMMPFDNDDELDEAPRKSHARASKY